MALNPQGDVPISDQGSELVLVPASARDGLSMGRGSSATWKDTQGPHCTKGCCAAQGTFQANPSWAIPSSSQLTIWGMYRHVPFLVFSAQKEQTQHSPPKHHFSYIFLSYFVWGFSFWKRCHLQQHSLLVLPQKCTTPTLPLLP